MEHGVSQYSRPWSVALYMSDGNKLTTDVCVWTFDWW